MVWPGTWYRSCKWFGYYGVVINMSINPNKEIKYFIAVITTQQEIIDDDIIEYDDDSEEEEEET